MLIEVNTRTASCYAFSCPECIMRVVRGYAKIFRTYNSIFLKKQLHFYVIALSIFMTVHCFVCKFPINVCKKTNIYFSGLLCISFNLNNGVGSFMPKMTYCYIRYSTAAYFKWPPDYQCIILDITFMPINKTRYSMWI